MAKAKKSWWVLTEGDKGVLIRQFTGPDRKRAREVAEKQLNGGQGKVVVLRVNDVVVLTQADLRAALPRNSF